MQVKSLSHTKFADIVESFNEAFADYSVKMPESTDFWEKRWRAARVDYNLSYGMFEEEKIVGFIINGIDFKKKKLTAFNSGTGVIAKYRGRRIVKQLYDFAIPKLIEKGVEICALEVISTNNKAIKAYQSVGFKITKTLKCFSGTLNVNDFENISTLKIPIKKINWVKLPNQEFYSWDFQKSGIEILKDKFAYFDVFENKKKIGYFILNPKSGTIAQFDLAVENSEHNWLKLFSAIKNIAPIIKINNIDDRQHTKIIVAEKVGLANTIDQFEMEYFIKPVN